MSYYECSEGHVPAGGKRECPYCVIDGLMADMARLQHVVDGVINAYPQLESIICKYLEPRNG